MKKNFILAILIASLSIVSLGVVSCESDKVVSNGNFGSSVTSVTLRNGSADAGVSIKKASTDASFTLTANVVATGGAPTTVRWTSSDTSVATVSTTGEVTIVGAGRTTIMAMSRHDSSKIDSVILTVEAPPSVTSVILRNGSADVGTNLGKITTDAAFTLTANVVATGVVPTTVTWTSSDTSVATVVNGLVTIVAIGTTIITATSTHDVSKSGTVTLTVRVPPSVTSVTLRNGNADAGANLRKNRADSPFTLTANVVVAGGAATTVRWTSSDPSVAIVANGLVTIVGAGLTTITATSTEDNTKTDSINLTVRGIMSVTLKNSGTNVGSTLKKQIGGVPITLTADVAVFGGAATTVRWTSSNPNVATVANGVVTIVGGGATTITATSTEDNTKTDSINLVVDGVIGVSLLNGGLDAGTTLTKQVGNPSFTLSVIVQVLGTIDMTVTWTSSNPNVATVANGVVTIVGAGTTTITATSTVDNGKQGSVNLTVRP